MRVFISAAFAMLLCLAAPALADTTYERVLRTGVIRCAYISWRPYSIKDANHPDQPPQGSSVDIMQALADRLGLRVDWVEEIGWGTIGEGFSTGRYDAVCTQMWPDAPKMRYFQLGIAMFYSDLYPYAIPSVAASLSESDLNRPQTRIAVVDGALTDRVAGATYPKATLIRLTPTTGSAEFFLTLTTKKADIIISDADEVMAQENAGLLALALVPTSAPVRVLPHVFAFPGEDLRFAAMMNSGLALLRDEGFFNIIKARYNLKARANNIP